MTTEDSATQTILKTFMLQYTVYQNIELYF